MCKNVLFLDDNPVRRQMFRSEVPFAKIVATVTECIEALKKEDRWDCVLLDHDLNTEVFVDSERRDCGMEVVRWLMENRVPIDHIIVHSHNVAAANRMISLLRDAGYDTKYKAFCYKIGEEIE